MLNSSLINDATIKYIKKSSELTELQEIVADIKKLFIDTIKGFYPQVVFDVLSSDPDMIKKQGDLEIYQSKKVSWRFHDFLRYNFDVTKIRLEKESLPLMFSLGYRGLTVEEVDNDFENADSNFREELKELLEKYSGCEVRLSNKVDKLRTTLSAETMNKTSIKKYFPELYKLIYDETS